MQRVFFERIQKLEVLVFHKKKVDLNGATLAMIAHLRQALEVYTGQFVEFYNLPLIFVPDHNDKDVVHVIFKAAAGRVIYADERAAIGFAVQGFCDMRKKEIGSTNQFRWEMMGSMSLMVIMSGFVEVLPQDSYEAQWNYLSASCPEVRVIEKFPTFQGTGYGRPVWRVGRDRYERHGEPLYKEGQSEEFLALEGSKVAQKAV